MSTEKTFGSFIREKRIERDISLRRLAVLLDISPVHMSNMENDRRPAPKDETLRNFVRVLQLDRQEQEELFDLAVLSKNIPTVPGDLPEYIMENELAKIALRTAKDVDATDAEWIAFIENLNTRRRKEDAEHDPSV
jgi:transcriptional regulator with XRE-family HTH domain